MRRRQLLARLASLALAPSCAQGKAPLSVKLTLPPGARKLGVYDALEAEVELSGGADPYKNEYDPDEIAIQAVLRGPGGREIALPGYFERYFTEFPDAGAPTPIMAPAWVWRVRIAPDRPGKWTLTVTAKDRSGTATSQTVPLTVTSSKRRGFLVRTPESKRYFAYSNGAPAFLVGYNVCWSGKDGLNDYRKWFPKLAAAGGNFARLWMAFQPMETKELGLGRYSQTSLWHFDNILELAQKHNLVCMLAFMTYGELATGGYFNEGRWPDSPYNARNGGPVPEDKPDEFFTNPEAKKLYKRRLRYLVARYAAFRSLGFWEFWNEKDAPPAWLDEMATYVRSLDPYRHPITNSYSTTGPDDAWKLGTMDLTQTHRYGDEGSVLDIAPLVWTDSRAHDKFKKPHLLGEFGVSWRGPDSQFDPKLTATNWHNGLWAGAMSGAAGTSMLWWWDSYVEPKNLYATLTGISLFAREIPWTKRDFQPISLPPVQLPVTALETFSDLVLTPDGGWGAKTEGVATVGPDGSVSGATLLTHFYGPDKKELRSVQRLAVNLPKQTTLKIRVLTVSAKGRLTIKLDDAPLAEFSFDASPGKGDFESTKNFPEYGGIYQALFNKDRSVEIPAGKHTLEIENAEGDWLQIGSLTFVGAKSSRYASLRTMALQDAKTGETLVWLQDPESHWKNDRDGKTPARWNGTTLTVPIPSRGKYVARFTDTRTGQVVATVTASGPTLKLPIPSFARDIAARIIAVGR